MAEGDDQDSSTTFTRQRRDLFVISAILLLGQLAEIKVEKLSFFGIDLKMENSSLLVGALWILWGYWYLRCYQAYKKLSTQAVFESYRGCLLDGLSKDFSFHTHHVTERLIAQNPDLRRGHALDGIRQANGINSKCAWFDWAPQVQIERQAVRQLETQRFEIVGLRLLWRRCSAFCLTCVGNMEVTEYWLPFIFALSPVIYWFYKHYSLFCVICN